MSASGWAFAALVGFLAAWFLEVVPILIANFLLLPLPRSAAENYPFSLVIGLTVLGGLLFHFVSICLALVALFVGRFRDTFAYLALVCNALVIVTFLLF